MPYIDIPLETWILILGFVIMGLSLWILNLHDKIEFYRDAADYYELKLYQLRFDITGFYNQINYLQKINQGLLNRINQIHRDYKKLTTKPNKNHGN